MIHDPVCGMTVEPSEAAAQSEFEGKTYYFCCDECHRQFDAEPAQFAAPGAEAARISCCGFGQGTVRHTVQRGMA